MVTVNDHGGPVKGVGFEQILYSPPSQELEAQALSSSSCGLSWNSSKGEGDGQVWPGKVLRIFGSKDFTPKQMLGGGAGSRVRTAFPLEGVPPSSLYLQAT